MPARGLTVSAMGKSSGGRVCGFLEMEKKAGEGAAVCCCYNMIKEMNQFHEVLPNCVGIKGIKTLAVIGK